MPQEIDETPSLSSVACPACDTISPAQAHFCANCGTPLAPSSPTTQPSSAENLAVVPPAPQALPSNPLPTAPAYIPAGRAMSRRWLIAAIALPLLLLMVLVFSALHLASGTIVGSWREEGTTMLLPGTTLRFGDDGQLYLNDEAFAAYVVHDENRLTLERKGEVIEVAYELVDDLLMLTIEGDTLQLRRSGE